MCNFSDDRAGGTLVVWTVITVQSHLPGNSPPAKLGRTPFWTSCLRPSASVAVNFVEGEGCINSFPFHHSIQRRRRNPNPFFFIRPNFFTWPPSTFFSFPRYTVCTAGGGIHFFKILTRQFSIVSPLISGCNPLPGKEGSEKRASSSGGW